MSEAFEDVFGAEFPGLHRYLHRRVGASAADDLTATAFTIAFTQWETRDTTRPVRPWLYGIAANLARRHWRDERRMLRAYARTGLDPVLIADDDSALDSVDARSQRQVLAAALAGLRPRDREILLLNAWAGLSDAEVAQALALPTGTVKSCLHRVRTRLQSQISRQTGMPASSVLLANSGGNE